METDPLIIVDGLASQFTIYKQGVFFNYNIYFNIDGEKELSNMLGRQIDRQTGYLLDPFWKILAGKLTFP